MKKKLLVLSILAMSTIGFAKYGWDAKTLVHLGTGFNPNSLHPNVSLTFYKQLESKSKIGFKIGGGLELGYSHYFHKEEEKTQNGEQGTENGSQGSSTSTEGSSAQSEGDTGGDTSTNTVASSSSSEENSDSSSETSTETSTQNGKEEEKDEKKEEESKEVIEKLPNHGYGVGYASVELFGNVHEDVMLYGGGSIGYNFMFKKAEERNKHDNQLYAKGFIGLTYKEVYTAELSYGSTNGLALGLGARIGF